MNDGDMAELESWLSAMLSKLSDAEQRGLARRIGVKLRRSQAIRIADQLNPDGSKFDPRKPQRTTKAREASGRIRREMFSKLRTVRHLKLITSPDGVSIGFIGRTAQIARVHQDGLKDEVSPGGPVVRYPARQLLGMTDDDIEAIKDMILDSVSR